MNTHVCVMYCTEYIQCLGIYTCVFVCVCAGESDSGDWEDDGEEEEVIGGDMEEDTEETPMDQGEEVRS